MVEKNFGTRPTLLSRIPRVVIPIPIHYLCTTKVNSISERQSFIVCYPSQQFSNFEITNSYQVVRLPMSLIIFR